MTFDDLRRKIDLAIEKGMISGSDTVCMMVPEGMRLVHGFSVPTMILKDHVEAAGNGLPFLLATRQQQEETENG